MKDQLIRLARRFKGCHFPDGFEAWVNTPSPSDLSRLDFSEFVGAAKVPTATDQSIAFCNEITQSGRLWGSVTVNFPNAQFFIDMKFHSASVTGHKGLSPESTNIWNLRMVGHPGNVAISGGIIAHLYLQIDGSRQGIRIVDCTLGHLTLVEGRKMDIELSNCWIGSLHIGKDCLKNLNIVGGGIANIECPPADGPNPFVGNVQVSRATLFPTRKDQLGLFQSPQAYRSLHSHLMKHDNILVANRMRALQLRAERLDERGFGRFSNWFYGTFANYGTSSGRPLIWLVASYAVSLLLGWWLCDYGHLTRRLFDDGGAQSMYLDEHGGRIVRVLSLPLQSIVNPFGTLFDSTRLIIPDTWQFNLWLVIQGLFSDFMLLLAGLSVRRRFKAG